MEFGLTDPLFVCGFHICQVWEKPDFMEQLSNRKPGQTRCFARHEGSQTHPATCKLYMSARRRYHHPLSIQLDPNPMDSTTPWANSPHFDSLGQYSNSCCLLGSLVNLTWAKQCIEFYLKIDHLFSSVSNSWKAFSKKRITFYSGTLRQQPLH